MARTIALNLLLKVSGSKSVDEATKKIQTLQGRMTKMNDVANAVGAGAAVALGVGFTKALDISASRAKLSAQLGLTGKESERVGNVAGKVFAGAFGESMEEVNGAVSSVIQNMKGMRTASSAALQQTTERALTLATVMGEDVTKVTAAVGTLMTTKLVPDAKTAFDVITRGAQLGANKQQDLLDTLTEYPTLFREMGLDAKTATGLLVQGMQAGARNSDIVADSIKEFSIRAKDGSKLTAQGFQSLGLNADLMASKIAKGGASSREALDLTLDRLRAIKDPVKQSQTAVALFGTTAEDLGQALFAMDLDTVGKNFTGVAGSVDKASKTMGETAASRIEVLKRSFMSTFVDVIGNQVVPKVEGFINLLKMVGITPGGIIGFGVALAGLAITVKVVSGAIAIYNALLKAQAIATKIGTAATWLFNAALRANPIGIIVTVLAALVGAIVLAYNKSETFRKIVQAAWTGIKTVISAVWNNVLKPAFEGIKKWIVTELAPRILWFHKSVVLPAWEGIKQVFSAAWVVIKAIFEAYKFYVTKIIAPVVIWLWKNIISPAFQAIGLIIKIAWNVIKIIFDVWKFYISKVIAPVITWLWKNIISPAFKVIVGVIKAAWAVIKIVFDAIVFVIKRTLGPVFSWLWKNAIKPVWDFISKHIIGTWTSKIKPIFDKIVNVIKVVVPNAFKAGVALIKGFWDKILAIAKTPVNFVIRLYNQGIGKMINKLAEFVGSNSRVPAIPYFAKGGVLPGYAPGRDSMIAAVSPGEAVMRPEFTKAVGSGFVNAANQRARTGGPEAVKRWLTGGDALGGEGLAFAKGGVVPGFAGSFGFGGIIGNFIKGVKDFTIGNVERGAKTLMDKIFAAGIPASGGLKTLFSAIPEWIKKNVLKWIKDKVGFGGGGPGIERGIQFARAQAGKPYVWGGAGPGGYDCSGFMGSILRAIKGQNPYSRMFSTHSFGASGGPGGFVRNQRSGFTVGVTDAGVGHMAGTLAGRLNVESRGSRGVVVGPGARGTNDGLFTRRYGLKFDQGGMLPTGTSVVHNMTGRPEMVLNPRQSAAFAGGGGDLNVDTINVYGVQDIEAFVKRLQKFAKDRGGIVLKIRT